MIIDKEYFATQPLILLIDKAVGESSNRCLQKVKRLVGARKAGHTGTLDPLASGMLPICLNRATKLAGTFLDATKTYQVAAQLGIQTITGDAEGEIIEQKAVANFSLAEIQALTQTFLGEITQIPPMYSALKHQGQPLYRLARKGIEIERQPRLINIMQLEVLDWQNPNLYFKVECSKGTYIRTLVEDMGKKLGCGAYMTALRRLNVGNFHQEQMITLAELEEYLKTTPLSLHQKFLVDMSEHIRG